MEPIVMLALVGVLAGLGSVPLSWYALRPRKALPAPPDPLVEAIIFSLQISPERWTRTAGKVDEKGTYRAWPSLSSHSGGPEHDVIIVYVGNGDYPTHIRRPAQVELTADQAARIETGWRQACADRISSTTLDAAPALRLLS